MMEVLLSSPMLTIQDHGRHGWRHLGVPRCGMMDGLALSQGNLLLGNPDDAAALEITLGPVLLQFHQPCQIVLMGADMHAGIYQHDQKTLKHNRLIPGFVYSLAGGDCLRLNQAARPGQRAMLMVSGGFDVPLLLGSRSTDLMNGFGGLLGRALQTGDTVPVGATAVSPRPATLRTSGVRQHSWNHDLRVLPGTDYARFEPQARHALLSSRWRVGQHSNRMGLRLEGVALQLAGTPDKSYRRYLSMGVLPGLIQVPPDGQPVILSADAQTTGGYPAIASIITCDLWQLAYMTPGTQIRFSEVSLAEAHGLARHHQLQLQRLRSSLQLQQALT